MNGLFGMYATKLPDPAKYTIFGLSVAVICISAYLLGSINFAIIISKKQYNQDIRNYGSNNAGMTNMMRTYGKKAAALTLIGDALKAIISCIIGYVLLGQLGAYLGGLFSVIGHIFPLYYKFKGGKGVITALMTILMCNPVVFIIIMVMFALIVLFTKYISLASVMCMLLYPLILDRIDKWLFSAEGSVGGWIAVIIAALIVFKHWANIKRLLNGSENKFSFKKSVKKSDLEANENKDTKNS